MHDQLTLQINKVNISVDRDRLKYDQNERGKIVDVTVLDTDGLKAYDLTGKNIRFFDLKQGTPPKIISDDGSTSTGGKFIRTPENDKLGKFSYQFQEFTYQQSGEAHFEFYTDKDHVDVTSHFAIDIIAEGQIAPDNSSYVSSMAELIDQLKAATDHASDSIGALTAASDTAKKTATDAIQAMQDQVATYAKQVTDAQAQWAQTKQDIDNRANAQLSSIQDLDKAQVDAAVKSITDKRDLALKQLNDDKTAELNAIQQDYNSWKTNTIADFTRSVQSLKDSIAESSEQLNQVSKQVNDTVTNMAALEKQFNSVDFTKFAKLTDLANYYTKNDVDNIVSDLRAEKANSADVYTKAEVDDMASGTIITDYDIASKTPTKEVNRYDRRWLIDQGVLGQFADQINQLKGRRSVDSADFNSLTDGGTYYISNPAKNAPVSQWGNLFVSNGNGHRVSQVYFPDDGNAPWYRVLNEKSWRGWVQLSTKSDVNNAVNSANAASSKVDTVLTNSYVRKQGINQNGDLVEIKSTGIKQGNGGYAFDMLPDDWTASKLKDVLNQLPSKANSSDVSALQNKANISSSLFRQIQNSNNWKDIFGVDNPNNVLTSLRINPGGSGPLINDLAAGIGFGGDDTKAVLSVDYGSHQARITGGNGTGPGWSEDIAWKSDISDLQNQIQQLKDNQFEVQTFTDATAAASWEAQKPGHRMAIVNS